MVEFIYLVKLNRDDKEAFDRFACSLNSISLQAYTDIQVCIMDVSEHSLQDRIASISKVNFTYRHQPQSGPYNRGHNANLGFKQFVKGPHFFISDIDIVYSPTHVQEAVKLSHTKHLVAYRGYRLEPVSNFVKKSYEHLSKQPGKEIRFGGGILCRSDTFEKLRGFNESYIGYGAEDSDLFNRAIYVGPTARPSHLLTLHLHHAPFDANKGVLWNRNKELYTKCKRKLLNKEMRYNEVNPKGWGE